MSEQDEALVSALAGNGDTNEDWGIRLGFYIHDVARLRRVIFDAALKPAGVTRSQGFILAYLLRRDGMAQSELATQLDLGKVALGGLVDRLEASGLLERRADADDGRIKRVFLTAQGRNVVRMMRKIAGPTNEEIMVGISARDIRATAKTLKAIKVNMLKMAGREGLV
jgi:DNA-binding MarR family transcriptional regulator